MGKAETRPVSESGRETGGLDLGGTASGIAGSASGQVPAQGRAAKKRILYYYEPARELHTREMDKTGMSRGQIRL